MGRLTSRAVVVSAAASGIGAVAARMLARERFVVVALDVTEAVEKVPGEICESGGKAYPLTEDVTDESTWHEAVAVAEQTYGGVDALVSNAYTLAVKPLHELERADRTRQLEVNLTGSYLGVRACLRSLTERAARSSSSPPCTSGSVCPGTWRTRRARVGWSRQPGSWPWSTGRTDRIGFLAPRIPHEGIL